MSTGNWHNTFFKVIPSLLASFFLLVPLFVFAQPPPGRTGGTSFYETLLPFFIGGPTTGGSIMGPGILGYISAFVPFALTLSVLFFLWGLARFVYNSGDEKSHEEGRQVMIWGVIAIFILVSIWGIARIILDAFYIVPANLPGVSGVVGPGGRPENTLFQIIRNDFQPLAQVFQGTLLFSVWLVFFYGIARFLWALSKGDEKGIETGKLLLVWGVIIFTVSISFWGIMSALAVTTGFLPSGNYMLLFPQLKEGP